MKWFHFLLAWVITVLIGSIFMSAIYVEMGLYFAVILVAAIAGSPTLLGVCISLGIWQARAKEGLWDRGALLGLHGAIALLNLLGLLMLPEVSMVELGLSAMFYAPLGLAITWITLNKLRNGRSQQMPAAEGAQG